MELRLNFIFVLVSLITIGCKANSLTFESFKQFITENSLPNVESVVNYLHQNHPANLKSPLLFYKTLSIQAATPMRPRIILYNGMDHLLPAWPEERKKPLGHSGGVVSIDSSSERIEFLEFDDERGRFRLKEIVMKGDQNKFNDSPKKCIACHGKNSRPIMEDYFFWPGAYGSQGYFPYQGGIDAPHFFSEREHFLKFNTERQGIYKNLDISDQLENMEECAVRARSTQKWA